MFTACTYAYIPCSRAVPIMYCVQFRVQKQLYQHLWPILTLKGRDHGLLSPVRPAFTGRTYVYDPYSCLRLAVLMLTTLFHGPYPTSRPIRMLMARDDGPYSRVRSLFSCCTYAYSPHSCFLPVITGRTHATVSVHHLYLRVHPMFTCCTNVHGPYSDSRSLITADTRP